jgi:acetyl esterase
VISGLLPVARMFDRHGTETRARVTSAVLIAASIACVLCVAPAEAQVSALPRQIRERLETVGPLWGGPDVRHPIREIGLEHIREMAELFRPLLKTAPKDGVTISQNLSYGPDRLNMLDVYRPSGTTSAPIVIFLHGGAFVQGDKGDPAGAPGNVLIWLARHGVLGINANYRLAPAAQWPAGAEDVGRLVAWARAHGAQHGGDTTRIYLIGHSAGANHAAAYAFDKSLQPADGPAIAGAVLISGRYRVTEDPADPNLENVRSYFGRDLAAYRARSPITHVHESRVPVFIVIAQYDHAFLDVSGAELLAALCERDRACPRFVRLATHNHSSQIWAFNTGDEQLGGEILDFIERGR